MVKNLIKLDERIINVALKAGTKKELDKLGSRRDSYDDIIRKLIKIYHTEKRNPNNKNKNLIRTYQKFERKTESIRLGNQKVTYSFNLPRKKDFDQYCFDIHYDKIVIGKKTFSQNYAHPKTLAIDYLKIIEKIISSYLDPLFKIRKQNRNILDLSWWKRKFDNLNLNQETYKKDIEEKLIQFGIIP